MTKIYFESVANIYFFFGSEGYHETKRTAWKAQVLDGSILQ